MIPSLIGLGFGLLWLFAGASALPVPVNWISGAIGLALFAIVAARLPRKIMGERPTGPFNRKIFALAVVFEVIAIVLAQTWLIAHGLIAYLLPVVGMLVGLHFIGLWLAWQRRSFLTLAGAMVTVNILAIALPLPMEGRLALSGFGSAAALLVTVAS
jgi:hypothetical protein